VLGSLGCRVRRAVCRVAFERSTIDSETAGGLSALGTPLFTDTTIFFSLRSSEYALSCFPTIPGAPSSQSAVTLFVGRPIGWKSWGLVVLVLW
jgi:hypothetical protein